MKKRLISILLCGALVLSMAACGSKEGAKKKKLKRKRQLKEIVGKQLIKSMVLIWIQS